MQALTDDTLHELRAPIALVPDPPVSPVEKVAGRFGLIATAIAATVVIVALILAVGSSRDAAAAARAETAAARAETVKAREAANASDTRAQAASAASQAASSALNVKTQQLTDLRAVAIRANNCIDATFPIMTLLVNQSYAAASRALDNLGTLCAGLAPLLRGTSSY